MASSLGKQAVSQPLPLCLTALLYRYEITS